MVIYDGDGLVSEGKYKIDSGRRLERPQGEARTFFCRTCGRNETATAVPHGWYSLARHSSSNFRGQRIGLYCSAACLAAMTPRLVGIERDLGPRWVDQTGAYSQSNDPRFADRTEPGR